MTLLTTARLRLEPLADPHLAGFNAMNSDLEVMRYLTGKPETLEDLIRGYSLKAKEKGGYVGEFTWDAKQKNGSEYEVTLLWKNGNNHRVALWRVDLAQKEVRPQGDAAASLPQHAREGIIDS